MGKTLILSFTVSAIALCALPALAEISVANTASLNDSVSFEAGNGGGADKRIVYEGAGGGPVLAGITYDGVALTFIPGRISDPVFGIDPTDRGLNDDPEGGGIANAVANFFGTNPREFPQGLIAGSNSGNRFNSTHPQSATPAADLPPAYRWSISLIDWLYR